jgi:hypothetical protein
MDMSKMKGMDKKVERRSIKKKQEHYLALIAVVWIIMDMDTYGWLLLYGVYVVLVGLHIDFTLILLAVHQITRKNNLILKKSMEYYFN